MTLAEIQQLPILEKFQIMEAIWQDLRSHVDSLEVPPAHKKLLDARRARVESGKAALVDWDSVKDRIGKA